MKNQKPAVRFVVRLSGMLLFGFAIGGSFVLIEILRNPHFPVEMLRRLLVLALFYCLIMTVFSLTLFPLIGRWNRHKGLSFSLVAQALGAFLLAAFLTNWIGGHLILLIYSDFNVLSLRNFISSGIYTILIALPVFLYLAVRGLWKKALQRVKEKELEAERLEKELLSARLQALQSQTNPHFLFNALNSIAALIATDPAGAEAAVERLAALFRYATDSHDGRLTALSEEIGVIEDYLAIEKIRFGERLQLKVEVDPSLLKCRVPPLLLQPMVENAIKHGVSQREDETIVEIKVEAAAGDQVRFVVKNQGPSLAPEEPRKGIGLRNVRSRCETLFGEAYSFRLSETAPGWIEAELVIPRAPNEEAIAGRLFAKETA